MPESATPTIFLKWTAPGEVVQKYISGFFSTVQLPTKKFTVESGEILAPRYDGNLDKGIFCFRDNSNNQVVIATTNQNNYSQYLNNGNITSNPTPEDPCECEWCRLVIEPGTVMLGIPISYHVETMTKYKFVQEGEVFVMKPETYDIHKFLTEGRHCDFSCGIAHIRSIGSADWVFQQTKHDEAEANLKAMFSLVHPDKIFPRKANHYRLLKRNGGSQTPEEWRTPSFSFVESPVVAQIPVKNHFQRIPI